MSIAMRRIIVVGVLAAVGLPLIGQFRPSPGRGETARPVSPILGVSVPDGYRDWKMIAVAHEAGLDELRAVLGNDVAVKAYQQGTLPFPNGTIFVKLAWKQVPVKGVDGAFVTGPATTVQVMVKDSKKYASTGGWGFGRFIGGIPVDEAQHRTCVPCHEAHVKDHDLVFTRFAR
jgi:hypothetical protein